MTRAPVSDSSVAAVRPDARWDQEHGASPVSSVVGVGVFLTFLLVVVQVVVYLFTASVVQAAAIDGASRGAGAAAVEPTGEARMHAHAVLGSLADDAVITAAVGTDDAGQVLTVDVEVRLPTVLGAIGLATVARSAEARIEQ